MPRPRKSGGASSSSSSANQPRPQRSGTLATSQSDKPSRRSATSQSAMAAPSAKRSGSSRPSAPSSSRLPPPQPRGRKPKQATGVPAHMVAQLPAGTLAYGIDSARADVIRSISNQNKSGTVGSRLVGTGNSALPMKVNDMVDPMLARARGTMDSKRFNQATKGFTQHQQEYEQHMEAYDEYQVVKPKRPSLTSGGSMRMTADSRRRMFGVTSKGGLNFNLEKGLPIVQSLDGMDMGQIFDPKRKGGGYFGSVSSQEIRHQTHNAAVFTPQAEPDQGSQPPTWSSNPVRYIRGGVEVPPPAHDPQHQRVIQRYQRVRTPSVTDMVPRIQPQAPMASAASVPAVEQSPMASAANQAPQAQAQTE